VSSSSMTAAAATTIRNAYTGGGSSSSSSTTRTGDDDAVFNGGLDDDHAINAAIAVAKAAASRGDAVVVLLMLGVVFPLSLHKSLGGLKFVTPASLGSMLLLTLAVVVRGSTHAWLNWETLVWHLWPRDGLVSVLKALPIYTLSYMCHFNALSMHAELTNPTRDRLKQVIFITIAVSTVAYVFFGIAGYLWAGTQTQGDVLQNFPVDDPVVGLGRLGLAVALLCNIPLMVLPARDILSEALSSLLKRCCESQHPFPPLQHRHSLVPGAADNQTTTTTSSTSSSTPNEEVKMFTKLNSQTGYSSVSVSGNIEEQQQLSSSSSPSSPPPVSSSSVWSCGAWPAAAQHSLLTLVIVMGAFQTAAVCPGVEVVWGLCGSSVGILLAATFPSAIYLKLRFHKGGRRMVTTAALFLLSLIVLVACSWASLKSVSS